ncbi:MAG: ABC transporter permease [Limnochordales bacterium]|nr:ABC transporter permease [Limnochordales bacterium]
MKGEIAFEVLRTLVAVALALALGLLIIYLVSEEPWEAFATLVTGPLTTTRRFGNFIEMAIPLIFTGLAISVVFQASQFNIGAEGQLFLGAVAATMVGIAFQLPPFLHVTAALGAAILAGALGGLVPGFLKARWGANELVSSLMLNYVYYRLGLYIINYHFRDERAGAMVSFRLAETAWLHQFWPPTRLHGGLFIALAAVVLTYLFLYHTRWGYALRMTGINASFAAYSGIAVGTVILYAQVLSGGIAGLAGGVEMLGILRRFQWQMMPGYGFDGIIVAILARNHPLLVPLAALFLAYLRTGADIMARMTDVTAEMVTVIQSVMILLVTAQAFLQQYRHRAVVRATREAMA